MWQEQLSEYTHPSRRVKHADTFIFAPYSDTVWMKPGVHVQNNVNEILVEMVKPASCTYLRFLNLNWKKHTESSLLMDLSVMHKDRWVDMWAPPVSMPGILLVCAWWLLDAEGSENVCLSVQGLWCFIRCDLCSFSDFWGHYGLSCFWPVTYSQEAYRHLIASNTYTLCQIRVKSARRLLLRRQHAGRHGYTYSVIK